MELLLLLTALLSGLTGASMSQRAADVPQMERSAAQATAEAVVRGAAQVSAQAQKPENATPSLASVTAEPRFRLAPVEAPSGFTPLGQKRLE